MVGSGLASTAKQQGRAAASRAFGLVFGVAIDRTASSAVYGVPEVAGVGLTEEQAVAANIPYVVGRCDLAATARGAIAGHGGLLKLIFRADDRTLLGVHCIGDIASEIVGLGHVVLHAGGAVELFLTLALNMPTYSAAYHDAAIDGLTRLAEMMGYGSRAASSDQSETSADWAGPRARREGGGAGMSARGSRASLHDHVRRRSAASTPYTEVGSLWLGSRCARQGGRIHGSTGRKGGVDQRGRARYRRGDRPGDGRRGRQGGHWPAQ